MSEESNIADEGNILDHSAESHLPMNTGDSQESTKKSPSFKDRRSALDSSYTALKYISQLSRHQFRKSDRVTEIIVFVCIVFVTMLLFAPTYLLKPPLLLSLDFIMLVSIGFFIVKRFGILITLSARQAVLVWDIVIATLVLGVLLCLNALLLIGYLTRLPFNLN